MSGRACFDPRALYQLFLKYFCFEIGEHIPIDSIMNPNFKEHLLTLTDASDCSEVERIQELWSGYGKISRYRLINSAYESVVVKCIDFNHSNRHPRGWDTDKSHLRKVKSYHVETYWYEHWNEKCIDTCRVPEFIGSFSENNQQWIVLEDLDTNFPLRKQQVTFKEVLNCLNWLANFHAVFLNQKPMGLWQIGTYWHLKTRPDEFEKIQNVELKSKAHQIDHILNNCSFQTIVHGDAKLANFCFPDDETQVSAVDFQYVGGGCGMKDVAYFLGSCLSSTECELLESELLDYYFIELKKALEPTETGSNFMALEEEWRRLYPVACADFTRFLMGWMPSHQKINDYNLKKLKLVLSAL